MKLRLPRVSLTIGGRAILGGPAAVDESAKSATYGISVPKWDDGRAIATDEPYFEAIQAQELYATLSHVFSAVRTIANTIASVPLRAYRVDSDGLQAWEDSELQRLLEGPNENETGYDLSEKTASYLELAGDAYWLGEGPGADRADGLGRFQTIEVLRPDRVRAIADRVRLIRGYRYEVQGSYLDFPREQVIHLRHFNPTNDFHGMATARPALMPAICDLYAAALNKNYFRRAGVLGPVLEFDGPMNEATLQSIVEKFNAAHQGVENAWKTRAVAGGRVHNVTPPLSDMLFSELRNMNRAEIFEVFGIPPVMLTSMDGATFANAEAQERQYWKLCILPKLSRIEARLNRSLARRYGSDARVGYDLSGVGALQEGLAAISDSGSKLVSSGAMTPNELRKFASTGKLPPTLGDPMPGGDVLLIPVGLIPLDEAGTAGGPPIPLPPAPEAGQPAPPAKGLDAIEASLRRVEELADQVSKGNLRENRVGVRRKRFEASTKAVEVALTKAARRVFATQLRAVVKALADQFPVPKIAAAGTFEKGTAEVLAVLDSLRGKNADYFRAVLAAVAARVGGDELQNLGLTQAFNVQSVAVVAWAASTAAELVRHIDDTTKDKLRDQLTEGIANGETYLQLSDRALSVLGPDAARYRANAIGRTEGGKAVNFSQVEAWRQTGDFVIGKTWVATLDAVTREDHAGLHGHSVSINQPFYLGGTIPTDHPGASGVASEDINCRCTIDPVFKGEEALLERSVPRNGNVANLEKLALRIHLSPELAREYDPAAGGPKENG